MFWKYTRALSLEFDAFANAEHYAELGCSALPWSCKRSSCPACGRRRCQWQVVCAAEGGAESAILRTWPDNDDSGLNDSNDDDVDDVDSEGNVHWPQAERKRGEAESEAEAKE